ncbi:hypothetical protein [Stappia sp.]|uniref:hypothetical protein n=1 Tax=Stappia sp. TaxID=1870903 RepID=UPI003A992B68
MKGSAVKYLLICVALSIAAPAFAGELLYFSTEGHQYKYSKNKNGAILHSVNPVSRFKGQGAATEIVTRTETIYLGKSCDASSEFFGTGTWGWANGGFIVDFPTGTVRFPRQEIDVPNGMHCQL